MKLFEEQAARQKAEEELARYKKYKPVVKKEKKEKKEQVSENIWSLGISHKKEQGYRY